MLSRNGLAKSNLVVMAQARVNVEFHDMPFGITLIKSMQNPDKYCRWITAPSFHDL
jgi:hypothetical protein